MNREDILQKAKKQGAEGYDEREQAIVLEGTKFGMFFGAILSLVLVILFGILLEKPAIALTAWLVYFAIFGSHNLYLWVRLRRDRSDLIRGIIHSVSALVLFVGLFFI